MKLLVFGHSDSDGSQIAGAADAFPWLLARMLKDTVGIDLEVVHRALYPGPTAAGYVERQVASQSPDIVIVATTTHSVVVRLSSNRVRERFGDRAAHLVHRAEVAAARHTPKPGERGFGVAVAVRRSARRILGVRPLMTPADLVASYADCMLKLARIENLHVIIAGGIGYVGDVKALNPGIDERQAWFQQRFRELAQSHYFDWLSQEAVLGGVGVKEQYYLLDGMHTDERSHRLFAEALLPLVLARA